MSLQKLLWTDERSVPRAVQRCARILANFGLWHQFSRNNEALSCQDAARKRNRLGHIGIPLWDELKSFLGEYTTPEGQIEPFLAHCRGDRELDMEKLRLALGSATAIRRRELQSDDDSAYGTVNPFQTNGIRQVFDHELGRPIGVPGTVMTNAGVHTWAVEFFAAELLLKLPNSRWADVIQDQRERDDFWGVRDPKPIGILTGNPIDSGIELCEKFNSQVRKLLGNHSLGDVSMPQVILYSTPQVGISMEMDTREEPLRNALISAMEQLCESGARLVAHPSHTTHYFAPELSRVVEKFGGRFISIVDSLERYLEQEGIQRVMLLGTRYMTDFNQERSIYRNAFRGIEVLTPNADQWGRVHEIGYLVQQVGPSARAVNLLRDLLTEVPRDCEHVILAMTELSPVARTLNLRGRQGKILINPLDAYARSLADAYLVRD